MSTIRSLLNELKLFFRQETNYTYLLICALALHLFMVLQTAPVNVEPHESPALDKFKQVQVLHDEDRLVAHITQLLNEDRAFRTVISFLNFILFFLMVTSVIVHFKFARATRRREEFIRSQGTAKTSWFLSDVGKMMILFYAFTIFSVTATNWFFQLSDQNAISGFYAIFHAMLADLIILGIILYFTVGRYGMQWKELGINLKALKNDIALGVLAYSWVFPLFISLLLVMGVVSQMIRYEPPPHALIDILVVEDKSMLLIWFSVILACIVGPIVEELFFRRFLYSALKKKWGVRVALIASSAAFGLVHESLFAFAPIFLLGLVFAYVWEKRQTLVPSIVMHMIHNTVLMLYFFTIKRGLLDTLTI